MTDQLEDGEEENGAIPALTTEDAEEFAASLPEHRRLIGIDLGTKTIGLALSDVNRTIATPLCTIRRSKFRSDATELMNLMERHDVCGLILGLPTNMDGSGGPRVQATRAFARNIANLVSLPILLWDERWSTAAAERILLAADTSRQRRAEVVDKVAAAIILQGALDRLRIIG